MVDEKYVRYRRKKSRRYGKGRQSPDRKFWDMLDIDDELEDYDISLDWVDF